MTWGVEVADAGGIINFRGFLARCGPWGERCRVAALGGAGPERHGQPRAAGTSEVFAGGEDVNDELLGGVGVDAVLDIIARHQDMRRFRTMQRQLEYRTAPLRGQVRRLMTHRKIQSAPDVVKAMELSRNSPPLTAVLMFLAVALGRKLIGTLADPLAERGHPNAAPQPLRAILVVRHRPSGA